MPLPTIAPLRESGFHRFDHFELDVAAFELRSDGQPIAMEPQVFEVLALLVQHHQRVVTKDEILDAVWPERYVTEAALNSRVMSARKALGDDGRTQRYIKTVHGRGYRFIGQVSTVGSTPSGPRPPAAEPSPAGPPPFTPGWQAALPAPSTSFIGRESELARIQELVDGEGRSLVSVVGPGGIGKTRLAIEAATRLQAAGHRVVYVSLEPVPDSAQLPGAIAAAIGLKPSTPDTAGQVMRHLAGTHLLLVLDNFEHLGEPATAFLSQLIGAAPALQVLVTSRAVLGLVEEWAFRVEGISFADGSCRADALQLFSERASQANAAAPVPSEDECQAIDEIIRLVDGLPLAIELAAALTPYLPYREIAALLAHGPSCLASDQQNATPRHRNMQSLLEESCRQLDPAQLRVLLSLAVFDGPFGVSAAGDISGASLPLLRQLVDKSLVQSVEGRFTLHPLMRQFTRERAGAELDELRRRHAEYYAAFLASRREALNGRGQVHATRDIDLEFTNTAAAWRWAAVNGRADLIDAAMYPLFCHLTFRARFFEADELASIAIRAVEQAGDAHADTLSALLMHHFWILSRLGRMREALTTLGRVNQRLTDGREPRPGIGMDPLTAVSVVQFGMGDYGAAAEAAITALDSARAREDQPATAFAAWLAGAARMRQSRLEWAELEPGRFGYRPLPGEEHQAALEDAAHFNALAAHTLEAAGETWLRAYVEIERGLIANVFSDSLTAEQHFRTACELRRAIGDAQGTASALIYLADTIIDDGRFDEMAAIQSEARDVFARVGDASGLTEAERVAGRIAFGRGDFTAAAAHFSRTLEMSAAIGFSNNVLSALRGMGRILHVTGRLVPSAIVNAFVAAHPAPTPFSRASAEFDLADVGCRLGADVVEQARATAATMDVAAVAELALAEMNEPASARLVA